MNLDISRTTLGIAAGIAGTLFLSYCIYFDKKRRSDPEYKKKIRESEYITGELRNWNPIPSLFRCVLSMSVWLSVSACGRTEKHKLIFSFHFAQ